MQEHSLRNPPSMSLVEAVLSPECHVMSLPHTIEEKTEATEALLKREGCIKINELIDLLLVYCRTNDIGKIFEKLQDENLTEIKIKDNMICYK